MMNQVNNVAAQGRYGDTMLMHVNPNEVKGLAQLGALSLNPTTGLPEAFELRDILPMVGSIVGGIFGGPAGSAIASGLLTAGLEGDFKKGVLAGLTSYGFGKALQGAQVAAAGDAAADVATNQAVVDAVGGIDTSAVTGLNPSGGFTIDPSAMTDPNVISELGSEGVQKGIAAARTGGMEAARLAQSAPGADPNMFAGMQDVSFGNVLSGASAPSAYIPAGIGLGGTGVIQSQEAFQAELDRLAFEEEERKRQMYLDYPEAIPGTYITPLPSASGGITKFANGQSTNLNERPKATIDSLEGLTVTDKFLNMDSEKAFSDLDKIYKHYAEDERTSIVKNYKSKIAELDKVSMKDMTPEEYMKQIRDLKSQRDFELQELQLMLDRTGKAKRGVATRGNLYTEQELNDVFRLLDEHQFLLTKPKEMEEGGFTTGITYDPTDPDLSGGFGYYGQSISDLNLNDPGNFYGAGMQYVPQREANPIPMGYMPGFMPEFNYFSNPNPSATDLQSGVSAGISDLGAADVPSAPVFSPTQSPSYQQFYGSAAQGVPQILDPTQQMNPFQVGPFVPPPPPPPPIEIPPGDDDGTPTPTPAPTPAPTPPPPPDDDERYGDYRLGPISPVDKDPRGFGEPSPGPSGLFSKLGSIAKGPGSEPSSGLPGMISELAAAKEPFAPSGIEGPESMPIAPPMSRQEPEPVQLPDPIAMPILEPEAMPMPIAQPMPIAAPVPPMPVQKPMPMPVAAPGIEDNIMSNQIAIAGMEDSEFPVFKPESLEEQIARNKMIIDMLEKDERRMSPRRMKEGGKFPDLNKDGKVTHADILKGRGVFQTGGMTGILEDPITQEVIAFILGDTNNESALNMFIDKYGPEVFQELRRAVLQSVVPNAQVEGQIQGTNQGGMADDIDGMIGNKQPVAVSQDEFIVPADVVSSLGDGSSDAGADKLYRMMDRVRQAKNGGTTQPPEIKDNKVLPA